MSDQGFIDDIEDMARGEGRHASHDQSIAGRCLYCSCGLRAQLTRRALDQARERLKGSQGISFKRKWEVVIYDDKHPKGFICLTTTNREDAEASVERHRAEGTRAEMRTQLR